MPPGRGGVTLVAAANQGHLLFYESDLAVQGVTFRGGKSTFDGGAIYAEVAILRIISCIFEDNTSSDSGGAISAELSQVLIAATTFHGNEAGGSGGAIQTLNGNFTIVDCIFRGNVAAFVSSDQGPTFL